MNWSPQTADDADTDTILDAWPTDDRTADGEPIIRGMACYDNNLDVVTVSEVATVENGIVWYRCPVLRRRHPHSRHGRGAVVHHVPRRPRRLVPPHPNRSEESDPMSDITTPTEYAQAIRDLDSARRAHDWAAVAERATALDLYLVMCGHWRTTAPGLHAPVDSQPVGPAAREHAPPCPRPPGAHTHACPRSSGLLTGVSGCRRCGVGRRRRTSGHASGRPRAC